MWRTVCSRRRTSRAHIEAIMRVFAPAVLAATLIAGPAAAAPQYHGHAIVPREASSVFDAAGTTIDRIVDRALVAIAVKLGGAPVAMNLRTRESPTR
jgi:hypothetical protein